MYNLVVMETFGTWLRNRRKQKGWSQKELHQKSGVSESYISTLEREQPHSVTGAKLRPEPEMVRKLTTALNEDVDYALNLAGYAAESFSDDQHKISDGLSVVFENSVFSNFEKAKIIDSLQLIVAGVRSVKPNEQIKNPFEAFRFSPDTEEEKKNAVPDNKHDVNSKK